MRWHVFGRGLVPVGLKFGGGHVPRVEDRGDHGILNLMQLLKLHRILIIFQSGPVMHILLRAQVLLDIGIPMRNDMLQVICQRLFRLLTFLAFLESSRKLWISVPSLLQYLHNYFGAIGRNCGSSPTLIRQRIGEFLGNNADRLHFILRWLSLLRDDLHVLYLNWCESLLKILLKLLGRAIHMEAFWRRVLQSRCVGLVRLRLALGQRLCQSFAKIARCTSSDTRVALPFKRLPGLLFFSSCLELLLVSIVLLYSLLCGLDPKVKFTAVLLLHLLALCWLSLLRLWLVAWFRGAGEVTGGEDGLEVLVCTLLGVAR